MQNGGIHIGASEPLFDPCSRARRPDPGLGAKARARSSIRISRWEPGTDESWSALVRQVDHANLAQSPQWFTAIKNAYGHTPVYLKAEDGEGAVALLPAFLVRSRWFGTVMASMPFLDGGGPCSASPALARIVVEALIDEAARLGAGSVEIRSNVTIDMPAPAAQDKVNLVMQLPGDPGTLWQKLNAKVRNQVRKAERSGLSVEFGGAEKLGEFYDIFAVHMRDLGSPVHAQGFFRAVLEAFGDEARVALVRIGTAPVGGLIALAFKRTLVVPWASSLREYFPLCANVLLYWETIRFACQKGFRRFDFGRSSRNSGTYHFKRQWGALEEPLYCYTIPIAHSDYKRWSSVDSRGASSLVRLWKHLPVGFTRWVGPHVRKYLTQ